MKKRKFSKNEIEDFVKNSKTYADVCRKCGWFDKKKKRFKR